MARCHVLVLSWAGKMFGFREDRVELRLDFYYKFAVSTDLRELWGRRRVAIKTRVLVFFVC